MATLFHIREGSTPIYTSTIEDERENALPAASLDTLTLTLYDTTSLAIINSRNDQDVLNLANVTVDGAGLLTWNMQAADVAIISQDSVFEERMALFRWSWTTAAGGTRTSNHEVKLHIQNLVLVT